MRNKKKMNKRINLFLMLTLLLGGVKMPTEGTKQGSPDEKAKEAQIDQGNKEKDDEIKEIIVLPTNKDGEKEGVNVEFLKINFPISVDKFFELFISDEAIFSSKERLQMMGKRNKYIEIISK